MRPRLIREDGNALVTAMLVTFLVLSIGLSAMAAVEPQQRESRKQRERESTFQLSESVLNAQIFQLSRRWPGTNAAPYPVDCTQASGTLADCPAPATVAAGHLGADYRQTSWTTRVRDNGGAAESFYDEAIVNAQPAWDANGDDMMWVRGEARLVDPANPGRFKRRVVVGLVRADSAQLTLPRATIVTDHFATANQGNKTIIDTNGANNEWLSGEVIVRCDAANYQLQSACAVYNNSKQRKQLDPDTLVYKPASAPTTLSADGLERMRARAASEGNYYASGCAPRLAGDVPGEVVFMENPGAGCTYNGNHIYNTATRPGVVVMGSGVLRILGNSTYYGLIYHANLGNSADFLVDLNGNSTIVGSVQVAGLGGVTVSGSDRVVFNPNFLEEIKTYGTAGIVQNSFREIPVAG